MNFTLEKKKPYNKVPSFKINSKIYLFIYSNQIKMMSKILFCSAMAFASVNAEAWDLQEEDVSGEPRLLDSVFNNTGHLILLCHKISF